MKDTGQRKPDPALLRAYKAWNAGASWRARRERCKRFAYGDQWSDPVLTRSGRLVTEGASLSEGGRRPLTNNLIRQLIKSIVGRFRTLSSEDGFYKDELSRRNSLAELDSRMLEEFLISGAAVQRVVHERRFPGEAVWVDNVEPGRFFVNSFRDPRGWDIDLAGMLHDMTLPEVLNRYGRGLRERCQAISAIYSHLGEGTATAYDAAETLGLPGVEREFFSPAEPGRCRVIEVWTYDALSSPGKGAETGLHFGWNCRIFAPDGTMLDSFPSPYAHGSHPFAVKFYPLTDGEVHSFVEDLVDQQKYINRLIVQIDTIMAHSAKGALLFPIDQKLDAVSMEEIAERWASPHGVIPITGRGTHLPQQVNSNGGADAAYQLLNLQMKLFENSSGVSDVLLGRNVSAAVGSENYRARVEGATIALADLLESFGSFREMRNSKAERI